MGDSRLKSVCENWLTAALSPIALQRWVSRWRPSCNPDPRASMTSLWSPSHLLALVSLKLQWRQPRWMPSLGQGRWLTSPQTLRSNGRNRLKRKTNFNPGPEFAWTLPSWAPWMLLEASPYPNCGKAWMSTSLPTWESNRWDFSSTWLMQSFGKWSKPYHLWQESPWNSALWCKIIVVISIIWRLWSWRRSSARDGKASKRITWKAAPRMNCAEWQRRHLKANHSFSISKGNLDIDLPELSMSWLMDKWNSTLSTTKLVPLSWTCFGEVCTVISLSVACRAPWGSVSDFNFWRQERVWLLNTTRALSVALQDKYSLQSAMSLLNLDHFAIFCLGWTAAAIASCVVGDFRLGCTWQLPWSTESGGLRHLCPKHGSSWWRRKGNQFWWLQILSTLDHGDHHFFFRRAWNN